MFAKGCRPHCSYREPMSTRFGLTTPLGWRLSWPPAATSTSSSSCPSRITSSTRPSGAVSRLKSRAGWSSSFSTTTCSHPGDAARKFQQVVKQLSPRPRLQRLHILFFIELASRKVHLGGISASPTGEWVVSAGPDPGLEAPGWGAEGQVPMRLQGVCRIAACMKCRESVRQHSAVRSLGASAPGARESRSARGSPVPRLHDWSIVASTPEPTKLNPTGVRLATGMVGWAICRWPSRIGSDRRPDSDCTQMLLVSPMHIILFGHWADENLFCRILRLAGGRRTRVWGDGGHSQAAPGRLDGNFRAGPGCAPCGQPGELVRGGTKRFVGPVVAAAGAVRDWHLHRRRRAVVASATPGGPDLLLGPWWHHSGAADPGAIQPLSELLLLSVLHQSRRHRAGGAVPGGGARTRAQTGCCRPRCRNHHLLPGGDRGRRPPHRGRLPVPRQSPADLQPAQRAGAMALVHRLDDLAGHCRPLHPRPPPLARALTNLRV